MPRDNAPGGLFSKVVKFVRNPATDWADIDDPAASQDGAVSKQAVRQMVERKRHNDVVRKREFDFLRQLRRKELSRGADSTGRPSFFQSSLPSSSGERAGTLKKIDDIEAQMSMQWGQSKRPVAGPLAGDTAVFVSGNPAESLPPATMPLTEDRFPSTQAQTDTSAVGQISAPPLISAYKPGMPVVAGLINDYDGSTTGFSASKLFAFEVAEVVHDPELEEAAIRFASGDDLLAEAGLLSLTAPGGSRHDHLDTWLALLDLHRFTGRTARFEELAIQFAQRFGRSAPRWLTLPAHQAGHAGQPAASRAAHVASVGRSIDWLSPPVLNGAAIQGLSNSAMAMPGASRLDWSMLQAIEPDAAEALFQLFKQWRQQPAKLQFTGQDRLEAVLQLATPVGESGVDPIWWHLRLEACRVMHLAEAFDAIALDYCVTYEVSPPSWERVQCDYVSHWASLDGNTLLGVAPDANTPLEEARPAGHGEPALVTLAGHITGDATSLLQAFERHWAHSDALVVDCSGLARVDFAAAGSFLNWASTQHALKRSVRFTDVHRLLTPFFSVIGISDYAMVQPRLD